MVSLGFVSINDARCQAQQWVNNRSDGLQILLVFFKQNSWGSTLHPTWGGWDALVTTVAPRPYKSWRCKVRRWHRHPSVQGDWAPCRVAVRVSQSWGKP